MDLIVFDLDGTLLNKQQRLSDKTIATLEKMKQAGIYYTIATGRTHLSAATCIEGHDFPLWQIYKNGVEWWHPTDQVYRHQGILEVAMIKAALTHFQTQGVTPFVFCIEENGQQSVYHPPLHDQYGETVVAELAKHHNLSLYDLDALPSDAKVINISALGHPDPLADIVAGCNREAHLVAYSGGGIYHPTIHWIDIHNQSTCKGSAIKRLQEELNADRLVVFGDGDNDLTMFEMADEAYATDNASSHVKARATATIGDHNEDGVAEFLLKQYNL